MTGREEGGREGMGVCVGGGGEGLLQRHMMSELLTTGQGGERNVAENRKGNSLRGSKSDFFSLLMTLLWQQMIRHEGRVEPTSNTTIEIVCMPGYVHMQYPPATMA